eukprot:3179364-Amphidinium_carterae.3
MSKRMRHFGGWPIVALRLHGSGKSKNHRHHPQMKLPNTVQKDYYAVQRDMLRWQFPQGCRDPLPPYPKDL